MVSAVFKLKGSDVLTELMMVAECYVDGERGMFWRAEGFSRNACRVAECSPVIFLIDFAPPSAWHRIYASDLQCVLLSFNRAT
jgi:hypothetical protein